MAIGIRARLAREVEIYNRVHHEIIVQDPRQPVGRERRENALPDESP